MRRKTVLHENESIQMCTLLKYWTDIISLVSSSIDNTDNGTREPLSKKRCFTIFDAVSSYQIFLENEAVLIDIRMDFQLSIRYNFCNDKTLEIKMGFVSLQNV